MKSLIQTYNRILKENCLGTEVDNINSLDYWQNKLFKNMLKFLIPFSLVALIPSVIYCFAIRLYVIPVVDTIAFAIVIIIAFKEGIGVEYRKLIFICCAYLMSSMLILYLGVKGPGLLFLYASCVFGLIILPKKYAYWWSIINTAVCLTFAALLYWDLTPDSAMNSTDVVEWLIISSNVIFLSLISSALLPDLLNGLSETIHRQKILQDDLSRQTYKLEMSLLEVQRKNEEIEMFAFVASHDLQEPLRMVASFLKLLEKRYGEQLDDKAKEYIYYAVDGAKRMEQIILELLQFYQVGKQTADKEWIDLNVIINEYRILRAKTITDSNAIIESDRLPSIFEQKGAMVQLFHNFLDNGLKYSRDDLPARIAIKARDQGDHWVFSITDNGIGIEPSNHEKIFEIFQRVHNRDKYSGTGIGLAIVKKIIDNLGEKVWLESEVDKGTTFFFTLHKDIKPTKLNVKKKE